jgi:hypothetical protein
MSTTRPERRRPDRALLVLCLVLLIVATSGTSYAAVRLAAGSVTSREVRDASLRVKDLHPTTRSALHGRPGKAGPRGKPGPQGPQGEPGAPALTTVVGAMAASSDKPVTTLTANTATQPANCLTQPYAPSGPDEYAVVTVDASLFPTGAATAVVYVAAGRAAIPATLLGPESVESLQDGVAAATATALVPLAPGQTYRFGPVVTSTATVNLAKSSCHTTALILRQPF